MTPAQKVRQCRTFWKGDVKEPCVNQLATAKTAPMPRDEPQDRPRRRCARRRAAARPHCRRDALVRPTLEVPAEVGARRHGCEELRLIHRALGENLRRPPGVIAINTPAPDNASGCESNAFNCHFNLLQAVCQTHSAGLSIPPSPSIMPYQQGYLQASGGGKFKPLLDSV